MTSVSGMSSSIEKPSLSEKPAFFWASFSLTSWDYFLAPLALEFLLAVESSVAVLSGLMLLDLLVFLDLLRIAVQSVSRWRVSFRDLNALSVS